MTERHFHWSFFAFDEYVPSKTEDFPPMKHAVVVDVIGYDNEENAKIAAADIIKRNFYVLRLVYECNTCAWNARNVKNIEKIAKSTE